jgi:hypothetical protein
MDGALLLSEDIATGITIKDGYRIRIEWSFKHAINEAQYLSRSIIEIDHQDYLYFMDCLLRLTNQH